VKMQDVHIQVSWMYVWLSEAMGKLPTRPASQLDRRVEFYAKRNPECLVPGMISVWKVGRLQKREIVPGEYHTSEALVLARVRAIVIFEA